MQAVMPNFCLEGKNYLFYYVQAFATTSTDSDDIMQSEFRENYEFSKYKDWVPQKWYDNIQSCTELEKNEALNNFLKATVVQLMEFCIWILYF